MYDDPAPHAGRGPHLLLQHCNALTGDVQRPPAFFRLEQMVGGELARMLVVALANRRPQRAAA